jgi:hypothetical protein
MNSWIITDEQTHGSLDGMGLLLPPSVRPSVSVPIIYSICRITRSKYYQLNVGDVVKFGSSSRLFIFQGPAELQPEE